MVKKENKGITNNADSKGSEDRDSAEARIRWDPVCSTAFLNPHILCPIFS